jgi:hypothetical protein
MHGGLFRTPVPEPQGVNLNGRPELLLESFAADLHENPYPTVPTLRSAP